MVSLSILLLFEFLLDGSDIVPGFGVSILLRFVVPQFSLSEVVEGAGEGDVSETSRRGSDGVKLDMFL